MSKILLNKKIILLSVIAASTFSNIAKAEEQPEQEIIEEISYTYTGYAHPRHKAKAKTGLELAKTKSQTKYSVKEDEKPWYIEYSDWKNKLAQDTGLSYTLDLSLLAQRGAPNGSNTSLQFQAYPSISWELFNNEYGSGTINASYTPTRYWNSTDAQTISNRIGVLSGINDYTTKSNSFDELAYSHQFAGDLKWLGFTVGQFPMYNFDGTTYNSNQQINFVNYALAQNASSVYPLASLGAYATFTISPEWQIVAGMQDAHNVSGETISSTDFGKGKYTSFASLSYTPTIPDLGSGQYSILVYNQPSTSEQPKTSNGWSLNMEQNLGEKWAIFARINGANNSPSQIEQSYVLGGVFNNPIDRNALDQIGFATALNKANKDVIGTDNTRNYETVLETYWAWGIGNWMTITPDFQLYIHPALNASRTTATVASLRTTFIF